MQETFLVQLDERLPDFSPQRPGWKITLVRPGDAATMEVPPTRSHPRFDCADAKIIHKHFFAVRNHVEHGVYERLFLDGNIIRGPRRAPVLPTLTKSL